jgi:predicted HNH restriction endonuclease
VCCKIVVLMMLPTPFGVPQGVPPAAPLVEGAVCRVSVNAYERNPEARRQCIEAHGTSCCICGFSFGAVYGEVAEGYIHVHHLRSLSEIGGEYVVDPVTDLRPVCPNCHAVLHRRIPAFTIEEVRGFLGR